ncbi:MAG: heavy-metal-associated domain-containing protein [Candidatus Marinimicrobia bacterium]|nr:heavy-metal-associated domain-containing protein [Candidatus Neomarinimicrobiota bacterium]
MKKLFLVMSLLVMVGCKGEISKAEINIPTAQCGMCAVTIENTLRNVEGVKKALVDMDALKVTVAYDAEVANVSSIENAISNAGYQANETSANMEVYKSLPGCCKLPADR